MAVQVLHDLGDDAHQSLILPDNAAMQHTENVATHCEINAQISVGLGQEQVVGTGGQSVRHCLGRRGLLGIF